MPDSLLDPGFIRQLERLSLQTRRVLGGAIKGERRSKRKGVSIEFADYRQYTRGDDLRFIDWNIYGRLDRLFIKLFYEEQDLQCHILLDASKSMDFGEPNKMDFSRRVAAAIAYIGLRNNDKIAISGFQSATKDVFPASRGKHQARRMLSFLEGVRPDGGTSLEAMARQFAKRVSGRCVAVVISDLLDPAGVKPALRWLVRDTIDVFVLHVLSPEEIEPRLGGHVELEDAETGHKVEMTINQSLKEVYMRNVEAYCAQIQEQCLKYGMAYSLLRTDAPLEDVMMRRMRENGLIRQ